MKPDTAASGLPASETQWAESVAARLRLVLSTTADDSRENRGSCLESEIRRELETVPPARQDSCLDALQDKFPIAEFPSSDSCSDTFVPSGPREPRSLEEILTLVEKAAANLNPDEKRDLSSRLAALGLLEPAPGESFSDLKQRLGIGMGESIAMPRLARIAAQETEFLVKLDQLAWNTWRKIAPRSPHKRDAAVGELRPNVCRYLRGERDPSDVQVGQQMERTRQLVASLIGALSQVSRGFVKRYQDRYAPDAIRELIKIEGRTTYFATAEMRCWRKYVELASEISEESLQADMQEAVVRYVDDLMRAPRGAV